MENTKSYEFKLRLLGNEVFAVTLSTSSDSSKWVALSIVTIFSVLTVLGAYGEQLMKIFGLL